MTKEKSFMDSTPEETNIFKRIFWRSANLMFVPSFSKQQGTTYSWIMMPFLEKIYGKETDEFYDRMKDHQAFFNIAAPMAPFVLGLNVSMEEENAKNADFDSSSIQAMKASLMGPLSGIGDAIFWGSLRVIATSIALTFSAQGSILGPLLFLVIFNVPNLLVRWFGVKLGYKLGSTYISRMMETGAFQIITKAFSVLGLMMVGAMSAQYVKFQTSFVTEMAGQEFILQDLFDSVMPRMLPLGLTLFSFWYIRKHNKPMTLMVILFALAIALTLLGITG